MHEAVHTMMISDIATSLWVIDFCHRAIVFQEILWQISGSH